MRGDGWELRWLYEPDLAQEVGGGGRLVVAQPRLR
jgi:hypothetical protein